jgi:hypothetical protein
MRCSHVSTAFLPIPEGESRLSQLYLQLGSLLERSLDVDLAHGVLVSVDRSLGRVPYESAVGECSMRVQFESAD